MEELTITKWGIDKAHSEVRFNARHLVISTVSGKFKEYNGGLEVEDDDFENAKAWFTADVNSISTGVPDRDSHLKSGDFFDAENHPEIKFESTEIKNKGDNKYDMTGNLTIRGITKSINLDVSYGGTITDPSGNTKAGFEITGHVNRFDFDLKWNAVTEAGNVVVGKEIKIDLNIQMIRK